MVRLRLSMIVLMVFFKIVVSAKMDGIVEISCQNNFAVDYSHF